MTLTERHSEENEEEIIRWFDEDGNEIINEPVCLDNLEHLGELGGEFEEFSVGINFYSKELDKEEITTLLGCHPTSAWNPNEKHRINNSGKTRMMNWGKWHLDSERDSTDLNIKIKDLLSNLTCDPGVWEQLTSKYECWVDIAGYMHNWNREFILKPDVMRLLSDRNLEIVFDIYFCGEEEEE